MFRKLAPLAALLLASCQAYPGSAGAGATLRVKVDVGQAGYRVAETVVPYDATHINHLVVRLYKRSGAPEVETAVTDADGHFIQDDITDGNFDRTLTFSNLRANTKYRVRGLAYKAAGFDDADLISTTGTSEDALQRSYADIDVLDDTVPSVASTLPVRLINKLFDGQATSTGGVAVTDGAFDTMPNEAIAQP